MNSWIYSHNKRFVDRLKIAATSGCLFVLIFFNAIFGLAQKQGSPAFFRTKNDTNQTELKLPNPFLKKGAVHLPESTSQRLSSWMFYQRHNFWTEISPETGETLQDQNLNQMLFLDWNYATPSKSMYNLDYRESSLYVPTNVREYVEFKMGRDRYLPLASLASAAFLANMLYRKYGYLLQKREAEKFKGIGLTNLQVRIMRVLWQNPGLTAVEWYEQALQEIDSTNLTFLSFTDEINGLNQKSLLKTRKFFGDITKYYAAISRQELILKLKDESATMDGLQNKQRLDAINLLLHQLENQR